MIKQKWGGNHMQKASNQSVQSDSESQSKVTMMGMFKFVFGTVLKRPWVLILNVVVLTCLLYKSDAADE